ncbi:MAG: alpha-glucosidase C-terminal domain-containing protein, partial [Candidatus Delongbacteria bacterium]|nr:alpha-glucosidase C-terminal domain-containing protein [Candidatus Delongbacteria bacterium]
YDATLYHHIDNNFGPNPDLDKIIWSQENPADPATWGWTTADTLFLHLIRACHLRGMKIIIDGVFNHTGTAFWAFQDILKNKQQSLYKDWYTITRWDDPLTPQDEFDYAGWYGIKDLPELTETEQGWIPPIRDHLRAVVKRWMDPDGNGDPSDGIDGWRLDVADMVKLESWKEFHRWVKSINPNAYLTGEVWWQDWAHNGMYNAAPWMQGDCFDGVMNYRFARAAVNWCASKQNKIRTRNFVDSLQAIYQDYHPDHVMVLQNLYDSHDVDRLSSQIINPDRWYDHLAGYKDNKQYEIRAPRNTEMQILRMMVALQFSLPGAPMIYYGDEAGMWGGDDPDCRKPMVWPDRIYDDEKAHPDHRERPSDPVRFDTGLFDWYRRLIAIRRAEPSLSRGDIQFLQINDSDDLLVFSRTFNYQTCFVIINNRSQSQTCTLDRSLFKPLQQVRDLITQSNYPVTDSLVTFSLDAYQVLILK